MLLTFHTSSADETGALGAALAGVLRPGDVVALDGELGAGKTCLVRGIAEGMGIDPGTVSSPTFVLIHEYRSPSPLAPALIHADAYRLGGPEDLETAGWDRAADGESVVVVEWASRIGESLAQEPSLARVHIERTGEELRRLTLLAPPGWRDRPGWTRLAALAEPSVRTGRAAARCTVCGRSIEAEGPLNPFCSERCRLVDLGRWLTGAYAVSRELTPDDLDDPDLSPPPPPPPPRPPSTPGQTPH